MHGESERRPHESALELIFNATNDFIFLIGVDYPHDEPRFTVEAVNTAYCRLVSRSPEAMVGRTIDEALPPERFESAHAILLEAIQNGTATQKGEFEFPQGKMVVEVVLRVIDWYGDRASRVLGVGRDITRMATSEAQLRASEEQFRAMADSLAEGVIITDLDDRALYINDRVVEMTGYSRDELLGGSVAEKVLTPEGRDAVFGRLSHRRAGESSRYEVEMVRKDGVHRWIEIGGAPFRDGSGSIVGTVGTMTDITDRRSIEEVREQMVSVVSHELRTPLGALGASLKLLQREVPPGDERAERLVGLAVRSADRMLRLVNDLLDLERLESSAASLQVTQVAVDALITRAVEALTPLADEASVRLIAGPTTCIVRADSERIEQVLLNLIGNAIKFSPHGGSVRIGTQPCGDHVELYVRDEGRGIPEDRLPALFRRFAQVHVDDARRKKGAGLGLAISRAIVEQHGGRIWAENGDGGGAVFRFTLPSSHQKPA